MSRNTTEHDVLDKIIEIGNRFPDYVYMNKQGELICQYTDGANGQGCIVGQALRALGVPYDMLKRYDQDDDGVAASVVLRNLFGHNLDSSVLNTIDLIQTHQDSEMPWGQAVKV